ncbi:hypothetical protein CsSME_00050729 [Camellia sinensis var. sinensis]
MVVKLECRDVIHNVRHQIINENGSESLVSETRAAGTDRGMEKPNGGGSERMEPGMLLSESRGKEECRPSINIEVPLVGAHREESVSGHGNPDSAQVCVGLSQYQNVLISSQAKNRSKLGGRYDVRMAGNRGRRRGGIHRNRLSFSGGFQRGALLRAAVAAVSLSLSQNCQISRKRKMVLKEAQATLHIGRQLGMSCEGMEQEVINKLVELENQDAERNFLALSGTVNGSFDCVLLNIYAPNDVVKRAMLWEIILRIRVHFHSPWSDLKRWNIEEFGIVEDQLKKAEEELHALDLLAESRVLGAHEIASRREDPGLVRQEVLRHFSKAFSEERKSRPKLLGNFISVCRSQVVEVLEDEFMLKLMYKKRNRELYY